MEKAAKKQPFLSIGQLPSQPAQQAYPLNPKNPFESAV
jgi:hypothetical protein